MATVYKKPFYYCLIHVVAGIIAFYYPIFGVVFLLYQLSQYFLNVRYFMFEWKIKDGNSLAHTSVKIGEFCVGLLIGYVVHRVYERKKKKKQSRIKNKKIFSK